MEKPPEKILMVDDDRNLLDSFRRQFRKSLHLETATSGADGVHAVRDGGPFAVVITDMMMPNMNGVEFLSRIRKISPSTVRIMLTGNANLDVAIDAVNDGYIFRFLNKPVESDLLHRVILDSIRQYRLITSEKMLLNKTLKGAVSLLSDILGLLNPDNFSESTRVKHHVHTMVRSLNLEESWHYDLAAMLSQIGLVALPPELVKKHANRETLSQAEAQLFATHPAIGGRLLKHIPRLELVAEMVARQRQLVQRFDCEGRLDNRQKAILGGQILKVAIAFDQLLDQGMSERAALDTLKENPEEYDPLLVETLAASINRQKLEVMTLPFHQLVPGLIIDQPVKTKAGLLLIAKGQVLSQAMLMRLLAAEESGIAKGPIRVFRLTQSYN
jgi:response regulator RpfG family c-di-GMP phosphodiesterase